MRIEAFDQPRPPLGPMSRGPARGRRLPGEATPRVCTVGEEPSRPLPPPTPSACLPSRFSLLAGRARRRHASPPLSTPPVPVKIHMASGGPPGERHSLRLRERHWIGRAARRRDSPNQIGVGSAGRSWAQALQVLAALIRRRIRAHGQYRSGPSRKIQYRAENFRPCYVFTRPLSGAVRDASARRQGTLYVQCSGIGRRCNQTTTLVSDCFNNDPAAKPVVRTQQNGQTTPRAGP